MTDRAELEKRIDDLRAELEEAEAALWALDALSPPSPCEGPFCVRFVVAEWAKQLEPRDTPLLGMLR